MRRADRLIQLVGLLKRQSLWLAEDLAEHLEVSVRTVYRDVAALQARGFAVEGQAGVGYMLRSAVDLPPLAFDHDERDALALGLAYVEAVGDPGLAAAARSARSKVGDAAGRHAEPLPALRPLRARQRPERRAPGFAALVRQALRTRHLIQFSYQNGEGVRSARSVRPLALTAYSEGWLLISWCLLREDFRVFRLDRMFEVRATRTPFAASAGQELADYLARHRPEPPVLIVHPV